MTKEEIGQILQILQLNYPQSFKGWSVNQSNLYARMWFEAFENVSASLVVGAVKAIIYCDTREFAPNIGQVRAKIQELTTADDQTEMEAWNLVKKALRNSAWESTKEFSNLPETIQRIVGSPSVLFEWSQMPSETVNSVIQSNFMRSYRQMKKREKDCALLPETIKTMLENHNLKKLIEKGG